MRTAILAWLLLATVAWSDPSISGPETVNPYKLVRLKAEGIPDKAGVLWDVLPVGKVDLASVKDRCCLEFVGPPGAYTVELLVATVGADGVPVLSRVRKVVTIGGKTPDPEPGPGPQPEPGPKPDPLPVPARAWLVVVEETQEARADRGKFLADPGLAAYFKAKGWKARIVDKDVKDANGKVPADVAPFIERARGKSLPVMYLVDQDGAVRLEGAIPDSPERLLALLKEIGG